MKKIAVLVPDFTIEHCIDFMEGVNQFFKDKDVVVYYAHTKFHKASYQDDFDYQYWISAEVLKAEEIQAYITLSGVYCTIMSMEDYAILLTGFNNRPVISASVPFDSIPNCYSVVTDCSKVYEQMVDHLVNKHNCKKIAFLSANSSGSSEALNRFDAYKKALEKYGLEYDDSIVFDGQFSEHIIRDIFKNKFKEKSDVNFDAIISANDVMAVEAMRCLAEIGINCPDDVKIFGFDDSIFASMASPTLSTVNQNVKNQGYYCAKLAFESIDGNFPPRQSVVDLQPVVRQSCGCLNRNIHDSFMDFEGNYVKEKHTAGVMVNHYMEETFEKKRYISLLEVMRASNTLRQLFYNSRTIIDILMVNELRLCLYNEPYYMTKNDDYVIPDEARLMLFTSVFGDKKIYQPDVNFNPWEMVCGYDGDQIPCPKGSYIIYPISSENANYGYMLLQPRKDNFFNYTVSLKIFSTFIAQAIDYTESLVQTEILSDENSKLHMNNDTLSMQNKTDELTQILNRRGFLELGQRTLDVMMEMDYSGIVFFGDLDRLKTINDKFGHEEGDRAICLAAKALKQAFRQSDVVGRLSGDEFGVVANGMNLNNIENIIEKVDAYCELFTLENELPYKLSISLGYTDTKKSANLSTLLTYADKSLYDVKKVHHETR